MSEQIMRKWTEAFKNADWETVASLYADDAVGSDPTGAIYDGREANLANDKTWRKTFSDFKFEFGEFIQSGNSSAVEMQVTATMTGEMEMPDGSKIPPTGKTVNIKNCFIYEFENVKIKSMKNYLDMMSMLGQLGLAG